MRELTHLSLFSGIGGLDLAAEWAGFKTVGQCEYADYPTKVLEKHWPTVERWRDIRTLTGESFYERTGLRTVDLISGGFPCQPFSVAGKQRGKEDDRYLWPEMVRVIKELRPTWIVGENVAGIVKLALPDILSELEAEGYRTRTFLIPACAVGSRHRRYRVAIVGYSEHHGSSPATFSRSTEKAGSGEQEREKPASKSEGTSESRYSENVAYTARERNGMLPDKWEKQGQENIDFDRNGKAVQYTNSTGCQELHTAGKPDKEGLSCGGCKEGDVCYSASQRLQDRRIQPMGGQGTPEQESERSGSYVSDTHNWSGVMRRDGKLPTTQEAGARRENNGRRTQEHESGKRRTAQSRLGGMADGIPPWLDGYWDVEPDIPRIAKGIPNRVERLKGLGNAVVPQQFYPVLKAIADVERSRYAGKK